MRSQQFYDGQRNGIKWAITFLHKEAQRMNDPHAVVVLNNAAFHMGQAAKHGSITVIGEPSCGSQTAEGKAE